jgi:hypothetical protein
LRKKFSKEDPILDGNIQEEEKEELIKKQNKTYKE